LPSYAPRIGDDEVLLRVHAAAVSRGDVVLLTGKPSAVRLAFGLRRPKRRIAGQNVAGVVAAVGQEVTTLKPGDAVYGLITGGFAEFARARADQLAPMSPRLGFDAAAAMPDSGTTRCRRCATWRAWRPARPSSLMVRPAASARSPCRSPRPWARP
jgi:NADPH:quinone reductase-like Zn-dependent oxidoreductase